MKLAPAFLLVSLLLGALACDKMPWQNHPPDPGIKGTINSVRGASGSDKNLSATVNIVFSNSASKELVITKYNVRWEGGYSRVVDANIKLARGGNQTVTHKVLPKDGNIVTLTNPGAKVWVEIAETIDPAAKK